MLRLDSLTCRRDERYLFEPISISIKSGECFALLGANGIGKSTLLRTLAGLYDAYDGQFSAEDVLFQGHRLGLDPQLTPLENIGWYCRLRDVEVHEDAILDALQRVDMLDMAVTPVARLSQGQQRRVSMAKWLLAQAQLWLLDEPMTALDTQGQELLNDILSQHCAHGGAVLCSTHVALQVVHANRLTLQAYAGLMSNDDL